MKKIYDYMPYVVLLSVLIIDIIIFYALMVTFKIIETEIAVAFIGFIGSVVGGIITLLGVQLTLKHRDREIFLTSATERLIGVEHLIDELQVHLNTIDLFEHSYMGENRHKHIRRQVKAFSETLNRNKKFVYKYLEYEDVSKINNYQETLNPLLIFEGITEEELEECIKVIRAIQHVLTNSKNILQESYYRYKKQA